jgi:putative tryptophan/tyrosine transport system substrate-binding protein
MMRRRLLVAFVCSFAAPVATMLRSLVTRAAEPGGRVVRLGFVGPGSPSSDPRGIAAFKERLRELGYVEGQNLVIETRWADGQFDQLPGLMAEVIALEIDVLVTYSTIPALAAKKATSTIPIVVAVMAEPLRTGLATNLARPTGNLTGLSMGWAEGIGGKWLELLQEAVPGLSTVAVIANTDNPVEQDMTAELKAIAPTRHLKLRIIEAPNPKALDHAFEQARRQSQAVLMIPDPRFIAQHKRIVALAARHRLPCIYGLREFADAGGLMAYGPDRAAMFRRAADYVDKILKGAKPGDLPIEQPTQFQLVVNLKTARALGLTFPESILLRADEVIR